MQLDPNNILKNSSIVDLYMKNIYFADKVLPDPSIRLPSLETMNLCSCWLVDSDGKTVVEFDLKIDMAHTSFKSLTIIESMTNVIALGFAYFKIVTEKNERYYKFRRACHLGKAICHITDKAAYEEACTFRGNYRYFIRCLSIAKLELKAGSSWAEEHSRSLCILDLTIGMLQLISKQHIFSPLLYQKSKIQKLNLLYCNGCLAFVKEHIFCYLCLIKKELAATSPFVF
jgi:hypothetical protein